MTPKPLLAVDDAIAAIASAMPLMPARDTAITDAIGLVLAAPVTARLSHPPAAVSAMDGFAGRADDLAHLPAELTVIGESAAGHPFDGIISAGECIRIFTGAHCPAGADTIILQEDTTRKGDRVTINEAPAAGRFIRPEGNDFATGAELFDAGTKLAARSLALIGSAGLASVSTRRKPVVAVLSTGDELVEPGTTPGRHQIISSNGLFLEHLITALGGEAMPLGIIRDSDDALAAALAKAAEADLIVTSGGASVGQHDGIARTMQDHDLTFWRIAMRPGKPLIFGHVGEASARTPLLGLPGNPVSTGVCGLIFVAAAIRAMLGQEHHPDWRHAILTDALPSNDRRQEFLRATLEYGTDGRLYATAFAGQDSGMLAVFAHANGLIMRPAHAEAAEQGAIVPVLALPDGI